MLQLKSHNPPSVAAPQGGYSLGLELTTPSRLLYISGQIPEAADGQVPDDFEGQCRQVWRNIESVLMSAGLDFSDLVKITTFLTDRSQAEANGAIRREVLGGHRPALTVMVAQTLEAKWLLEIEAVAAG